ncbi:MAG: hypothetical protein E7607_04250 [Ruminococcaceae bacterium]|nr:hypothetical protein [Oscillospiraceae bacterium]
MKKTYLAIIFTFLLTFSCILSACSTHRNNSGLEPPTHESETNQNYSQQINDLKSQILELEKNSYISEVERENEIKRLEDLIEKLKKLDENQEHEKSPDGSNTNNSSPNNSNNDNGNEEDTSKFLYKIEDGKAIITGFTGNSKNIVIPSAIDGYTVNCIHDEAFAYSSVENITIPDTVTKIGWFAFKSCPDLKSITIPNSVNSIGYSAFTQTGADFSIICSPDSFAAKYAQSYGIDFKPI